MKYCCRSRLHGLHKGTLDQQRGTFGAVRGMGETSLEIKHRLVNVGTCEYVTMTRSVDYWMPTTDASIFQGSHSTWKTLNNEYTSGKSLSFVTFNKNPGKLGMKPGKSRRA